MLKSVREAIINGLEQRMAVKLDAKGNVKRLSWDENRELVVSTLLDPRFKAAPYLNAERIDEYKTWLINEAEKLSDIQVASKC